MNESSQFDQGRRRHRGFGALTSVSESLRFLDSLSSLIDSESIRVDQATDRILYSEIVSPVDLPSFARSAMDGYAIGGSSESKKYRIVGDSKPGLPYDGQLDPSSAVRILTGAPVPPRTHAVIPIEKCIETQNSLELEEIPPSGKHVIQPGEDVKRGTLVLSRRRCLRPHDIALVSSMGIVHVEVFRKPSVCIATTGSELLPPGSAPRGYLVSDSNSVMLHAMITRDQGVPIGPIHAGNDPDSLRAILKNSDWDTLIVSGGSSVGSEDYSHSVLRELAEHMIHGIDMKPGMPAGIGVLNDSRVVFLLPGNPVACAFTYDIFARRHIRRLAQRSIEPPYRKRQFRLAQVFESAKGRVDFVRVSIDESRQFATPLPMGGASNLSRLTQADGYWMTDENRTCYDLGELIEVNLFDESPVCN